MGKKFLLTAVFCLLALGVGLIGCGGGLESSGSTETYDITGSWAYSLLNATGSYWDQGTITFSGTTSSGTVTISDAAGYGHTGTYMVDGSNVTITGTYSVYDGSFTWNGSFTSRTVIEGAWSHTTPQDNDEDRDGTWSASKM